MRADIFVDKLFNRVRVHGISEKFYETKYALSNFIKYVLTPLSEVLFLKFKAFFLIIHIID